MKALEPGRGIVAMGVTLVLAGLYGMWAGWEQILIERGWAQFIAGASAISGGVVTIALGRVIAAIRSSEGMAVRAAPEQIDVGARGDIVEMDRYVAGDAEYVMLSDGSIEVRRAGQVQRFESLAALREISARRA
ncbi:MAG: hypothetical protein N2444_10330 [Methylocystis sp.]|nr:hypothetical protein [Methylocystis sp.]